MEERRCATLKEDGSGWLLLEKEATATIHEKQGSNKKKGWGGQETVVLAL